MNFKLILVLLQYSQKKWEKVRSGSIGDQINIKFGFVDISNKQNKSILENFSGGRDDMLTPTVLFYGKDK